MSWNSFIFNYMCKRSDGKRDAGLTTPAEVERIDNIQYGESPKWQILDLYRPKEYSGNLPVIVSVHGGGWVYGTKETYQFYCMDLAKRGFAVVNFTYRLSPKSKHPAAIEDTNSAFKWVLDNADKYNLDKDNIFAVGDSAGAQCLAIYACILTNPEYAGKYSFKTPEGLSIKGIALNCGIYNAEKLRTVKSMKDYLPKSNPEEILHDITVIHFVTENFPPAYVMTSNEDFLREEPDFLLPVFKEKGVRYEYKKYGDDEHLLYHVFHCNMRSDEAKIANDDECYFFKSLMNGQ